MSARRKLASVSAYLKALPSSLDRTRIRKTFRRFTSSSGVGGTSGPLPRMNPQNRVYLHDAIYEVENELESRGAGRSDDPRVVAMRAARNRVLDDLGWNEPLL